MKEQSAIAAAILDQLSEPFTLENNEVTVSASIGISLFPDNGNDIAALLKKMQTRPCTGPKSVAGIISSIFRVK